MLLCFIVFLIIGVSRDPVDLGRFYLMIAILFSICELFILLLLMLWFTGTFKYRFRKALGISALLVPSSFIIGYLFILIESLVRK